MLSYDYTITLIYGEKPLSPISELNLCFLLGKTFHPRILCAKFGWIWPSCSGEEVFCIDFRYFVITSPLNPLHPKMLCVQFSWKWPSGPGSRKFIKFQQCIFAIISHWKEAYLSLVKLESPLPKDALCQVW